MFSNLLKTVEHKLHKCYLLSDLTSFLNLPTYKLIYEIIYWYISGLDACGILYQSTNKQEVGAFWLQSLKDL